MLLRYLKTATLIRNIEEKQPNGTRVQTRTEKLGRYRVQTQELTDEISSSIYGANIYKMLRLKSIRGQLEKILYDKVNNKADNVSNYNILIDNKKYKIVAVNSSGIDAEMI